MLLKLEINCKKMCVGGKQEYVELNQHATKQ